MLDDLIAQLQSRDPSERRQAIIALGRTKNLDALTALQNVYRTDTDSELRELARKAGAYIRQQADASASAPPPAMSSASVDDEDAYKPSTASVPLRMYTPPAPAEKPRAETRTSGREFTVSRDDIERAKGLMDSALSANMRGDNARAMRDLAQAIKLNPNLINDKYFGSVAASVTGTSGDEAVRMIVDGTQRKQFVDDATTKVKRNVRDEKMANAKQSNSGGVLFELIIYLVINIVFPIILAVIVVQVARANFAGMEDPELAALGEITAADVLPFLDVSVGGLIIVGLIVTVALIISTLFQTFMIHIAALLLGGVGTFVHLLDVMLSFYNRFQPILYVLLGLNFIIAIATIGSFIPACSTVVLVGFMLYYVFKTASKVGEAYGTGAGLGCLTLVVSSIIIGLVNVVLSSVVGNALAGLLTQFTPTPL